MGSFMGGANFWGTKSGNETFVPPSYNDKLLEVVAVFSMVQLGMAIVVPEGIMHHHRIAQCKSVSITILGDEPIPLEVDGEAWLQRPGIVKIEHKNTVQVLAKDKKLESALESWEFKHRYSQQQQHHNNNSSSSGRNNSYDNMRVTDEEVVVIGEFIQTVTAVTTSITNNNRTSWFGDDCDMIVKMVSSIIDMVERFQSQQLVYCNQHIACDLVKSVKVLSAQLRSHLNKESTVRSLTLWHQW